jgi:predicted enzyme related to lactoylglutathione lyase
MAGVEMSFPFAAGAVVYAKNLSLLGRFYRDVMGLRVTQTESDHVVLESPVFQLVVVAIPSHLAADIHIASPPQRREDTAVKLIFAVSNIAAARSAAAALGGELNAPDREWEFQGERVCDGHDPEGNVVQVRESARVPWPERAAGRDVAT